MGRGAPQALTSYVELALVCLRATAYAPQLGTFVLPKLKRMAEIYATSMPTVDGHVAPTYALNWQPTPGAPSPTVSPTPLSISRGIAWFDKKDHF